MHPRLTSSHLVGRIGELAELELALGEASTRRPVLVLLGGESGVGKTRLVTEFERGLAEREPLVLRGEAVEEGDTDLPYAPLVGAMRPLVRSRHPGLAELSPGTRAQLAAVLPGLEQDRSADRGQDGAGQLRVFEALLELLDSLSQEQPLVLILEDMHWADRSTRTFVAFLSRTLRDERLMVVLTFRTDELHRRHALRPLLSELERVDRVRRVDLRPFDREEMAEALTDILGGAPTEDLVARLYGRSEGNPLYTEELLAAGLDGRGAAPQSLRDAFMLRIERLSADAQRAVRAIAVGRRLEEATISQVVGIEHTALHAALREAVEEQVLVAGEDGQLMFRHALLREAVYDDLLPGERGELHLALARLLEERLAGGDDRRAQLTALIAGHYASAGDQPAALRAAIQAATAGCDVHAFGEAAHLYDRALELWPRVPNAEEVAEVDHVSLLTLAATSHGVAGAPNRAEILVQTALAELSADSDPRRYSALLARLARLQWSLNRGLEGVETAQRALSLLPADEPSRERASLLAWLARTQHLRGRFRDARADAEEALTIAVAAGDRGSEAEILNTLGMAQIAQGEVDAGIGRLRHAIQIGREIDDPDTVATAHGNLADLLYLVGRTSEALDVAREGLAATPRRVTRSHDWLRLVISELSLELGDWKTARTSLEPPPSNLEGTLLMFHRIREADLALAIGDEDRADECLNEIGPSIESSSEPQWIGVYGSLRGELSRRRRDLIGARMAVQHALDRLEVCTDDVMRIARVTAAGVRIEADFAQRGRDLREKAQEREAITRARIHMQRLRAAAQDGGPVEKAWLAHANAEYARARGRDDSALWAKAAAVWDGLERPYYVAIARWHEAEAQAEAGERMAAAQPAQRALQIARGLGSEWLSDEVSALIDRARLTLEPGDEAERADLDAEADAVEDPFGLTPRERQVLALVAEGATNRQIGAALFMAEKTASVHVSRILSKLGVRSRTQAAAVAHRMRISA